MSVSRLQALKTKAKLLQKAKAKSGKPILLKTALTTIAKHSGFPSWRELKENIETNEILWSSLGSAMWHNWQANYDEALKILKPDHFLLPYQNQFFICDINYIKSLGLSEDDKDVIAIGNNWVQPKDRAAWERIIQKIKTFKKVS